MAKTKRKLTLKRKDRPVYVLKVGSQYLILPPDLKDIPGAQRINPCMKTANPARTGNFTLKTLAKKIPRDLAADRFAAFQRSGQYSELRLVQVGKSFYNIVGYKWPDKGVRRKLNIGRARINPSADSGVTPNQVRFGSRGRVKVGWINAETPTRYQITYKDGPRTKTVWRLKGNVTFVKTGKRGHATANPSPVERAAGLSRKFHGAAPRIVKHIDFRSPKCLALIGSCAQLDYVSDKWDGKRRQYYHKFEKPCLVLADPDPQPDGSRLIVILGKFRITERGIIG